MRKTGHFFWTRIFVFYCTLIFVRVRSQVCVDTGVSWTWKGPIGSNIPGNQDANTGVGNTFELGIRFSQCSVSIVGGGNFMFGGTKTGTTSGFMRDLWQFNSTGPGWNILNGAASATPGQPSSFAPPPNGYPGGRKDMSCWGSVNGFYLFGGTGYDTSGSTASTGLLNDLWWWNGVQWTLLSGSQGSLKDPSYVTPPLDPGVRESSMSWVLASDPTKLYLFGGHLNRATPVVSALQYMADLWMFDTTTNLWTFVGGPQNNRAPWVLAGPSAWPSGRQGSATWTDNLDKLYLYGGNGITDNVTAVPGALNDLWVYTVSTGTWTFLLGTSTLNTPGTATLPAGRRQPTIWTNGADSTYMFGGWRSGATAFFNDIWRYSQSTNTWTNVGSSAWSLGSNRNGIYGTVNLTNTCNFPGSRYGATGWVDGNNDLWLQGGLGYLSVNDTLNPWTPCGDAWQLRAPAIGAPTPAPTLAPTAAPTAAPTLAPTSAPTTASPTTTPPFVPEALETTTATPSGLCIPCIVVPVVIVSVLLIAGGLLLAFLWKRKPPRRNSETTVPVTQF